MSEPRISERRKGALLLSLQLAALWPVWQWYGARVINSAEGKWGLLPALTALLFLLWKKDAPHETGKELWLPALFLLLYAVSYTFLPPLLRAVVALTALGCTLSLLLLGRMFHTGLLGLLYLALPLIPSLQFYGGYPLRVLVASVAAPVLRLGGFNVVREGTCLNWGGQLIWIDAPCSGVRMLWVGLFLACALICLYDLRPVKSLLALAATSFIVLLGNIFRAVALFYVEARVIELPAWSHEYIGVVAFVLVAAGSALTIRWMRRERACAQTLST